MTTALKLSALMVAAVLADPRPAFADKAPFVPGQILLRLSPGATITAFNARYATTTLESIPSRNVYAVTVPPGMNEDSFAQEIRDDPEVQSADLNFYASELPPDGSTQSLFFRVGRAQYDADQSPSLVNAQVAWNSALGAGITVAVLDTGVDVSHPELANRIAPGGFNFLNNSTNTVDTPAGLDSDGDMVFDEFVGHGTLVSGLIARIAPAATILPIKVMDSDGISTSFRLSQGIYHAIDNGASVINISLGTLSNPTVIRDAVAEAHTRGISVVATAGNDGKEDRRSPAGLNGLGVIAVAATNSAAQPASFTNFGSWITICAPGVNIVSTVPDNGYGMASGTSFSAPIVAGAIAVLRSGCPIVPNGEIHTFLSAGATPVSEAPSEYEGMLGHGILNLGDSTAAALAPGSPCRCDRNFDRVVDIEDLYLLFGSTIDANGDGQPDHIDLRDLTSWLRRYEPGDMLPSAQ